MTAVEKANALRTRLAAILKATIDTVTVLTKRDDISTVTVYSAELERNWHEYNEAFAIYEKAAAGKDDLEVVTAEYTTIHASVLKTRIILCNLMTAFSTANVSTLDQSTSGTFTKTVKLPPCKLPIFSGNIKHWPEFRATCRSILTEQVPEVHRLQYLKEALTGEPRELISYVMPGEGAYEKAMYLLKNRFENHRLIVNEHLNSLYSISRIESFKESADTLRIIVNTVNALTSALRECEIDVSTWDSILIFNTSQSLHLDTVKAWEETLNGSRSVPKLIDYLKFLETRISILQTSVGFITKRESNALDRRPRPQPMMSKPKDRPKMYYTLKAEYKCAICKRNHLATRCDELRNMQPSECRAAVSKAGLCFNCFQAHLVADCPFSSTCKKCNGLHHTLLHSGEHTKVLVTQETEEGVGDFDDEGVDALSEISSVHFYHVNTRHVTILATALVPVQWNGRSILLTALIDQGATTNLISEHACQMLRLPIRRVNIAMTGVGGSSVGRVTGRTINRIGSIHESQYNLDISALVVKQVAKVSPLNCNERTKWRHLRGLQLANPNFTRTRKVDMLLGAGVYADILLGNIARGGANEPIAQQTKLGWIVFGQTEVDSEFVELCHALQPHPDNDPPDDLSQLLQSFWELEQVECTKHFTADEQAAENSFVKSSKRSEDGKFVVDLPFRLDPSTECLGTSRNQAEKRLRSSQRRFAKHPEAKRLYDQNLSEYLTLGHMVEVGKNKSPKYFLPHHPVVKESSSTTKVRTVFDASAKTTNGQSLNDILYVGPTIQPELFDLLIQWRRYKFAFCGDIEKMYRQVWVNPDHALYQCILWQEPSSTEIKEYKLLTVTFGVASAPFLAIRALHEAGHQTSDSEVGEAIKNNFYVDDFLGNADNIEDAVSLRQRITNELVKYGFVLRKWKANDKQILNGLDECEKEEVVDFDTTFKTLGITWQPSADNFAFKPSQPRDVDKWTKRAVLSEIAKLYDPLGWLSPVVTLAKILMQDIWRLPNNFGWDTSVPDHIAAKWQSIYVQLCLPIPIQVPRWLGLSNDMIGVQIHGFCDASIHAYAASVYVKIRYRDERIVSNLVASKTKLAPIKTISIPRLELCGAVLLSKLLVRCKKSLGLDNAEIFAWSDSMIALAWISACPSRWSTFVANRVSQIQTTLPITNWRHVPTKQNPADIASRGVLVQELSNATLWWHGPEFLLDASLEPQPMVKLDDTEIPEQKSCPKIFQVTEIPENFVLSYFSSYSRLLRFTALAFRWRNRIRGRNKPITAGEITKALYKWVTIVQRETFTNDISNLRRETQVVTPALKQLCPFIDEHGILRMNGRVGNADLKEQRTAIILPAQHSFTTLVIQHAHEEVLHGGVQLTLRKLREKFWIIHARNQAKKLIHKCVKCFRFRKQLMNQQMADLPSFRTQMARPFAYVGVDYTGYFEIKSSSRRNAPLTKGYIAVFICLTTKAMHLELVPDLSTAEFVMAFENFISRRGIPIEVHSDNGTNFIGGAREIHRLFTQMVSQNNQLTKLFAFKNIEFKTIPARASHMAGIWERAVGSVKYHLRRVLKDTKLTSRQFDHVLKQIEACLNSRPLWALSPEKDDIEVLTPSHFFNFQPINTLPRPDLASIPINRLDQYQYLYRIYCSFWKDWSNEYLHQFQARPKWLKQQDNAKIGQIVLISEDNLPPSRWALGKITNVHPGADGLVRSVDVRCGKTILRRPIHRLALLPILDNEYLELMKAQGGENVVTSHNESNIETA